MPDKKKPVPDTTVVIKNGSFATFETIVPVEQPDEITSIRNVFEQHGFSVDKMDADPDDNTCYTITVTATKDMTVGDLKAMFATGVIDDNLLHEAGLSERIIEAIVG